MCSPVWGAPEDFLVEEAGITPGPIQMIQKLCLCRPGRVVHRRRHLPRSPALSHHRSAWRLAHLPSTKAKRTWSVRPGALTWRNDERAKLSGIPGVECGNGLGYRVLPDQPDALTPHAPRSPPRAPRFPGRLGAFPVQVPDKAPEAGTRRALTEIQSVERGAWSVWR